VNKDSFRKELLQKLQTLSRDELILLNTSLTHQLVKLFHSEPELRDQIGAAYLPFKVEVAPVFQELLRQVPLNLSYPVMENSVMKFGLPHGFPKGSTWLDAPFTLVEPEWILVPGVGFDLSGARLGRGKGYYDRYFEEKDALRIGLAWSQQLVDKIPVEGHDCHMDFILTDSFCFDVSQQKRF
jgi:5-formyltetrahydrofolate cyclo-ligase